MKVKELNEQERPREKALDQGVQSLSNRELIAILIRSGTKQWSALEVADKILNASNGLGALSVMPLEQLMQIDGIKSAKGLSLLAAFELGRRIAFDKIRQGISIEKPQDLVEWLNMQIGFKQQEHFIVLFLNQKNQILCYRTLFKGTLTNASVHPREIFQEAMRVGCARIICVHNHPSGDASPSDADIAITQSIVESGHLVSIPLMDHIIVSKNTYKSFRQMQLID